MKLIVTPEKIVSSLFLLGYKQIHPVFYSTLVSKVLDLDSEIAYEDKELSYIFKKYTILDEEGFHFKQGYNINTNISEICYESDKHCSFKEYILTSDNKMLLSLMLSRLDLFFITLEAYNLLPNEVKQKKIKREDMLK